MTEHETRPETPEELLAAAEEIVETLVESLEEGVTPDAGLLEELWEVADAAEDVLETVDVTELLSEVDLTELPSAVEVSDLPEAVAEQDPGAAADLRALTSLADMASLWEVVDARAFWRQSRELDDEVDDVTGEDLNEYVPGDWEPFDDDETADGTDTDVDTDDVDSETLSTDDADDVDAETLENAVQAQVSEAVEEFRDGLLRARARLASALEENRIQSEERRSQNADSRNPTAVSTMPAARSNTSLARHSTVPEETKYSTAPNRRRIYGDRFDEADTDG